MWLTAGYESVPYSLVLDPKLIQVAIVQSEYTKRAIVALLPQSRLIIFQIERRNELFQIKHYSSVVINS